MAATACCKITERGIDHTRESGHIHLNGGAIGSGLQFRIGISHPGHVKVHIHAAHLSDKARKAFGGILGAYINTSQKHLLRITIGESLSRSEITACKPKSIPCGSKLFRHCQTYPGGSSDDNDFTPCGILFDSIHNLIRTIFV